MSDTGCNKLSELLQVESNVIKRHLSEHAWCNHIPDPSAAIIDFINRFGWVMKEMFCEMCDNHHRCCVYAGIKEKYKDENKI